MASYVDVLGVTVMVSALQWALSVTNRSALMLSLSLSHILYYFCFSIIVTLNALTGWLSFSDVVSETSVIRIRDESLADQGRVRIEVACGKV